MPGDSLKRASDAPNGRHVRQHTGLGPVDVLRVGCDCTGIGQAPNVPHSTVPIKSVLLIYISSAANTPKTRYTAWGAAGSEIVALVLGRVHPRVKTAFTVCDGAKKVTLIKAMHSLFRLNPDNQVYIDLRCRSNAPPGDLFVSGVACPFWEHLDVNVDANEFVESDVMRICSSLRYVQHMRP